MKKFRLIHQNSNMEAPEGRFDVGRSIECNLVLDDPSVSRVHATIVNTNGKLILEDRGSKNGCLLNGSRADKFTELKDGDLITIGHQTIRVVAMDRNFDAERTLGLVACLKCSSWMSSTDTSCPHCGAESSSSLSGLPKATREIPMPYMETSEGTWKTQQPNIMINELIKKAISMERYEEAERLLQNLMESTVRREKSGEKIGDKDLHEVTKHAVALALATSNPRHVSSIFSFHAARGRLMTRESTEMLYNVVKKVGYRSCPEMNRYLSVLSAKAGVFTPGEKFIHRRIEGLMSLCS